MTGTLESEEDSALQPPPPPLLHRDENSPGGSPPKFFSLERAPKDPNCKETEVGQGGEPQQQQLQQQQQQQPQQQNGVRGGMSANAPRRSLWARSPTRAGQCVKDKAHQGKQVNAGGGLTPREQDESSLNASAGLPVAKGGEDSSGGGGGGGFNRRDMLVGAKPRVESSYSAESLGGGGSGGGGGGGGGGTGGAHPTTRFSIVDGSHVTDTTYSQTKATAEGRLSQVNQYKVIRQLGEGATAKVYLVEGRLPGYRDCSGCGGAGCSSCDARREEEKAKLFMIGDAANGDGAAVGASSNSEDKGPAEADGGGGDRLRATTAGSNPDAPEAGVRGSFGDENVDTSSIDGGGGGGGGGGADAGGEEDISASKRSSRKWKFRIPRARSGSGGERDSAASTDGKALFAMKMFKRDVLRKQKEHGFGRGSLAGDDGLLKAMREVALMKLLIHPNVVQLHEVIDVPDEGHLYLIIDYVRGGPLMEYDVDRAMYVSPRSQGPLPPATAASYFTQILGALEFLHTNYIVHRDLKPENVLVDNAGNARISDFGVSHSFQEEKDRSFRNLSAVTRSKSRGQLTNTQGTWCFWAPEMADGEEDAYNGFAADVWAAGVCLWLMCFQTLPYSNPQPLALFEMIAHNPLPFPESSCAGRTHPQLLAYLGKLLHKDPKQRISVDKALEDPWLALSIGQQAFSARVLRQRSLARAVNVSADDVNHAVTKGVGTRTIIRSMRKASREFKTFGRRSFGFDRTSSGGEDSSSSNSKRRGKLSKSQSDDFAGKEGAVERAEREGTKGRRRRTMGSAEGSTGGALSIQEMTVDEQGQHVKPNLSSNKPADMESTKVPPSADEKPTLVVGSNPLLEVDKCDEERGGGAGEGVGGGGDVKPSSLPSTGQSLKAFAPASTSTLGLAKPGDAATPNAGPTSRPAAAGGGGEEGWGEAGDEVPSSETLASHASSCACAVS